MTYVGCGFDLISPKAGSSRREHHISFRRSIYASRSIKAGELLTEDNLTVLRPFHGLCASRFDDILGCRAKRDIHAHQVLNENDLERK